MSNRKSYLGKLYDTVQQEVDEKWRDQIDPRVYNTLMNYEVNIDD